MQQKQRTHSEVKADKRASALRDNLKKRKALAQNVAKDKQEKSNDDQS
jgi:hypothetical protein